MPTCFAPLVLTSQEGLLPPFISNWGSAWLYTEMQVLLPALNCSSAVCSPSTRICVAIPPYYVNIPILHLISTRPSLAKLIIGLTGPKQLQTIHVSSFHRTTAHIPAVRCFRESKGPGHLSSCSLCWLKSIYTHSTYQQRFQVLFILPSRNFSVFIANP